MRLLIGYSLSTHLEVCFELSVFFHVDTRVVLTNCVSLLGWSHGIFHCVLLFTNPIILKAALSSLLSQEQIQHAAKCAVLAEV